MADDGGGRPAARLLRIRPTAGSIFLVIGAITSATILVNVFGATRRILGWTIATLVVAWLASAVIDALDRRLPRALAVIVTLLVLVLIGVGIWVGVVATVRQEVGKVRTALPEAARNLEDRYEAAADFRLAERVQTLVDDLNERFSTRRTVTRAAETAPTYFITGILMLFFVVYGRRFVTGGLNQIPDPARRARVAFIAGSASRKARAYLLVSMGQVIVSGLLATLVFWILDMRAPFVLGMVVGLLGAIPYVGYVLGGLVPLLVAAADPQEPTLVTMLVLAFIVALQVFEIRVIRRELDRRTVHVGPAPILIVAILAFELYGLGGVVVGCSVLVLALAVMDALGARTDVGTLPDAVSG